MENGLGPKELRAGLNFITLESTEVGSIIAALPAQTLALAIYGSQARSDSLPESDIDLLALVPEPEGSRGTGRANISCYTAEQLTSISGTLFGMHLKRDAVVLAESDGQLSGLMMSFEPPDPVELLARVRHFSAILNSYEPDVFDYLSGLIRLARYLLRTAVYAEALRLGDPCFSVRQLAERFNEPSLVSILSSDPGSHPEPSVDVLSDLKRRLAELAGDLPQNPWESIAALAVGEWESDRDRSALAILAMSSESEPFDYSELPKVLL